MSIIENVKSYFSKKQNNDEVGSAPEGVCPNCWGKQEWDGEYFKFIKGENGNPSTETYDNFIKDVARKLDKITLKNNAYVCKTCQVNQNKAN
jgi:hypothetical protein